MSELTNGGTWGQAFLLWFWTNTGGFIGFYASLNLELAPYHNNHAAGSGPLFVAALVSLYAAVPWLMVLPLIHPAFKWVLQIHDCWPRLLTMAAAITGGILFTLFLAGMSVTEDEEYLLHGFLKTLGLTYWVAAMSTAATVYRQNLFRSIRLPEISPLTIDDTQN